jgi:hypothetical protein
MNETSANRTAYIAVTIIKRAIVMPFRRIPAAGNIPANKMIGKSSSGSLYLESCEVDALEGRAIDYRLYFQATRTLSDLLSKIGLKKESQSAEDLGDIIEQLKHKASKKKRRRA